MHNDNPLVPGKPEISRNMLSSYCLKSVGKYRVRVGGVKKLVPNLVKIHKILMFRQAHWIKKFIYFNTEKRKNSGS